MILNLHRKIRIKRLYKKVPNGSWVICVDEFGPLEIRPVGGATWAKQNHPNR